MIVEVEISARVTWHDGVEQVFAATPVAAPIRGVSRARLDSAFTVARDALGDRIELAEATREPETVPPVVMFAGYGRAGKDEAAKIYARLTGVRYTGSLSWVGLPHVAAVLGLCEQEAWETRHARREEWKRLLDEYRADNPARLIAASLRRGPIVVGVRDRTELLAARARRLVRHVVWVERAGTPVDPTVTYTAADCTRVLVNPVPYGESPADGLLRLEHAVAEMAAEFGTLPRQVGA